MTEYPTNIVRNDHEPTQVPSLERYPLQPRLEEPVREAADGIGEEGPSFFCPCLLTPPLIATRALGLCGGHEFGISTAPDIATVTIGETYFFS